MKKQIGIFICGLLAGMLIVLLGVYFNNDSQAPGNLKVQPKLFDHPTECVSRNNFKVFQALSPGYALAVELEKRYSGIESASGMTVLIYDEDGRQFEDDEEIKMPRNKCARQIGTYKYGLSNGDKKEVPVIQIMECEDE